MDSEQAKLPAILRSGERPATRRRIVSRAGELVQENPDKFRVVALELEEERALLEVETALVYEDGDISLRLSLRREGDQLEQELRVFDGSDHRRKVIYRLDITRGMIARELLQKVKRRASGEGGRARFYQELLQSWEWAGEVADSALLVDSWSETAVPPEVVEALLETFDGMKLPDPPLGMPFAPTLQQLMMTARRKNDKNGALLKMLPSG